MKVVVTGADGFIGRNLCLHLSERKDLQIVRFTRANQREELWELLNGADVVFHLAGVNRPQSDEEFESENFQLTNSLCNALIDSVVRTSRKPRVIFASSTQALLDNAYGRSKRRAEEVVRLAGTRCGVATYIFRLPNVFGKWCRPNYNSVVATFCHNVAHGEPIHVNHSAPSLRLVYIDDLVRTLVDILDGIDPAVDETGSAIVSPIYDTTVADVARQIEAFRDSRNTLVTERVGRGLVRALYSTYLSYLPKASFSYDLAPHADARGIFTEVLKTPDCGQISFFTAHPGVTRGGHYHHTKAEKFLVLKGEARFGFRHMATGETHEIRTNGRVPTVVETIPGWTHDITNVGSEELLVMLWASELFERARPDTIAARVSLE
jgi:UDP-2-acetamido-2,6-beta-L-arabino-hexul-4-ose reductase